MKQKNTNNFSFIFYLIIFRASLDFLYLNVLDDFHLKSYLLSYIFVIDVNIFKLMISWVVYLISIFYLSKYIIKQGKKASEVIILGLFLMSFVPTISLFGLANLEYGFLLNLLVFWFVFLFTSSLFKRIKFKKITMPKTLDQKSRAILWYGIVFIFCFGVLVISWRFNGLQLNLTLDSIKVYDLRAQAASIDMGIIVDYFRYNAMYIVIPLAGLYFYRYKNWIPFLFIIYLQLLLYSIGNQKAALFLLPASILAYTFYRGSMLNSIPKILVGVNLLIYFEHILNKSTFLIASILERIYYLPAMLSYAYYEFFSVNSPAIPFVSLFKKIGLVQDYNYDAGIPYIIGEINFYNSKISANTGMFGSAFSYGMAGLILIPIVYSLLFILLDSVSKTLEVRSILSILILQVFVITGATIFVVLTVYGYFTVLLMLWLSNNNKILENNQTILNLNNIGVKK